MAEKSSSYNGRCHDVSGLLITLEAKVTARRHLKVGLARGLQVGKVSSSRTQDFRIRVMETSGEEFFYSTLKCMTEKCCHEAVCWRIIVRVRKGKERWKGV